ncbi:MAG: hypothetical protein KGJ58_04295 [Patescibacteria group bacterium]|nr:hypothetical protein [Patescibacteria group bacterium]MDE1988508.1 hypothetical protein [Patescibacteria group bacterium]MDE2218638.1 hypothetical protein [Patescibacteria group bacterium]
MRLNFKFKKIAGVFFGGESGAFEAKEIHPRRDWNIVLGFFILAIILSIVLGFYTYGKIDGGGFFAISDGKESPVETIDRSELNKIINFYEAKSQLFQEIKAKKPEIIDPSL